jgi:hypothetical protein
MSTPPSGIPEADWLATPASVRTLILAQQQEIQALRQETDRQCGLLLHALHGAVSHGRGGLWVIKIDFRL